MTPGTRKAVLLIMTVVIPLLCLPRFGFASEGLPKDDSGAYQYTYDYLFMIDALIRHEKYQRARVELDALLERVKQRPNETALARQAYGYLSIGINDYAAAIEHFLFAVATGALPDQVSHNLRYTLAQLLYHEGRFREGLQQLQAWFAQRDRPTPESRVLSARLHYGLKQWKQAVEALKLAIAEADSPRESWYQMLVGIYFEQEWFKQSVPVLRSMLKLFPGKPQYWQQLSGVLLQLGRERQAVAVLSLAAEQKLLNEAGQLRLARLYLQQNNPLDAAELLAAGLDSGDVDVTVDNLNLLVDAWLLARDQQRALAVLGRLAEIDKSGSPQLRAGRVLMESEQWRRAVTQLEQGISLISKPAFEDWLLLGNAHYRLENREAAKSAFEAAQRLARDEKQRQLSGSWIEYLGTSD